MKIEAAFCDVDRELKLRHHLAGLHHTTSVTTYTKNFHCIALEIGDQVSNDAVLLFIYVKGLKSVIQMSVLLSHPD